MKEELPKQISDFIETQHVASVSFVEETTLVPYCFTCFYAFDKKNAFLIFKSSRDTRHASSMDAGKPVAGSILPDKLDVLRIQGIQFAGHILPFDDSRHKVATKTYYGRYPFARIMSGDIWVVQLHSIKMTDNKTGIGTKIKWNLNKAAHEI